MNAFYTSSGDRFIGSCDCWMWWPIDDKPGLWRVRHDIGLLQGQFNDPSNLTAVVDDFGDLVRVPS